MDKSAFAAYVTRPGRPCSIFSLAPRDIFVLHAGCSPSRRHTYHDPRVIPVWPDHVFPRPNIANVSSIALRYCQFTVKSLILLQSTRNEVVKGNYTVLLYIFGIVHLEDNDLGTQSLLESS